jgi:hypothetical protein
LSEPAATGAAAAVGVAVVSGAVAVETQHTTKHVTVSARQTYSAGPAQATLQGRLWAHAAPHANEAHCMNNNK